MKTNALYKEPSAGTGIALVEEASRLRGAAYLVAVQRSEKIRAVKDTAGFRDTMGAVLAKAAALAGIKGEFDPFVKEDIMCLIMSRYGGLSIAEVSRAFQNDRYGINGERAQHFQMFGAEYVATVIDRYAEWKRDEMKRIPAPQALPERTGPTEEEMTKKDKALLAAAYATWRATGRYEDYGNYMYKVAAKKLGLFSPSEERREKYLAEGKKRAAKHCRDRAFARPMERQKMERDARDAEELSPGTDGRALAYREALQLALIGWFEDLKEAGTDMEQLLETNEKKTEQHGNKINGRRGAWPH